MNWVLALGVLIALTQSPVDILDIGVAFTGSVTFKRGAPDTTFMVTDHDALVIVKLSSDEAFSVAATKTMSYKWGHALAQEREVRIRLADIRSMPVGTEVLADSLDLFLCTIAPQERTDTETLYALECVAFDKTIRPSDRAGGMVLEAGIVVSAPTQSAAEKFLSRPRKVIYARLERIDRSR